MKDILLLRDKKKKSPIDTTGNGDAVVKQHKGVKSERTETIKLFCQSALNRNKAISPFYRKVNQDTE